MGFSAGATRSPATRYFRPRYYHRPLIRQLLRLAPSVKSSLVLFQFVIALVPPAAQAQIDATFPHVAALKAIVDTLAYPTNLVCGATRDYIEIMEYRAMVLWQDLAVLHPKMRNHPIFAVSPFNGNAHGFLDFKERQTAAVVAFPSLELGQAARDAQARGDLQTADVLSKALPLFAGLANGPSSSFMAGSPLRLLQEAHHAVVQRAARPLLTEPPAPAAAQVAQTAALAAAVASDPITWPAVPATGLLPYFATAFEFRNVLTLEALSVEWTLGSLGVGGGDRGPPVKHLELHYGPSARNGKGTGASYRSKHLRGGSQRVDNAYNKRKVFYQIVDSQGSAGVALLQVELEGNFGGAAAVVAAPSWSQVSWILDQLIERDVSYGAHRQRGVQGAAKRQRTERPVSEAAI